MTWAENLKRIRRNLRDPNGRIWSDAYLLNLFNDVQREFQHKTKILEDVRSIRYPPTYHCAYIYDWEWPFLPVGKSQFYQAFQYHHQSNIIITYDWESQNLNGINSSVSDYGARFTQPFESAYIAVGDPIKVRFPTNFHTAIYMAYDKEPVKYFEEKAIADTESTYKTRTGDPFAYYRPDNLDNSFILFPAPTVNNWADGEGMALFINGETVSVETGDILVATNYSPDDYVGISLDILDSTDNVILVYDIIPTDILGPQDESDYPSYLQKYIEYGVISRAYGANTDGRIPTLAEYWAFRYETGIGLILTYKWQRQKDRTYRFKTEDIRGKRNLKHARLPDEYPAV